MDTDNEDYWYNKWHLDTELHKQMFIKDVNEIPVGTVVSVYGDTDSIFVGFEPAIKSCQWKNNIFNEGWLNRCPHPYKIITDKELNIDIDNDNYKGTIIFDDHDMLVDNNVIEELPDDFKILVISGNLLKNYRLNDLLKDYTGKVVYNWGHEIDFIHGLDKFRIAKYYEDKLTEHANSYGVENLEDFELEKISESIINLEKKKYIQHITWEDGIDHERFSYIQPKGVELVRSSTPMFARDKEMGIYRIVNYLFAHPDDFTVKELMSIIKEMRREFELADVDDISAQSSCNKYNEKVIHDKEKLEFVTGTHFAVKAAAFHNYLLHKHPDLHTNYEFLKSGDKIKYYYTNETENPIFAFKRGEFPIEYAPEVDYDTHFDKVILSPVNNIIKKIGMPEINKRLSVLMDVFGGL
tara:strand:+ start:31882 stop:33111 length:1230 start_codon:yes stop_codon:yes gene_type:complete